MGDVIRFKPGLAALIRLNKDKFVKVFDTYTQISVEALVEEVLPLLEILNKDFTQHGKTRGQDHERGKTDYDRLRELGLLESESGGYRVSYKLNETGLDFIDSYRRHKGKNSMARDREIIAEWYDRISNDPSIPS